MSVTTAADGIKDITTPLSDADVESLKAGDRVRISGVIYTARDAAHGRLLPLIEKGETLPIDVKGAIIYYTGPTPAQPGDVVGAIGPTTASRMDKFTPALLRLGLKGDDGEGVPRAGGEGRATRAQGRVLRGHRRRRRRAVPARQEAGDRRLRGSRDRGDPAPRGRGVSGHRAQRLSRR